MKITFVVAAGLLAFGNGWKVEKTGQDESDREADEDDAADRENPRDLELPDEDEESDERRRDPLRHSPDRDETSSLPMADLTAFRSAAGEDNPSPGANIIYAQEAHFQ